MKPIIYDITLIADKIGSQLQVNAKSGEHKSRSLRIQIVKDSRPFLPPIGATISLRGKHENGTMYLNTCALNAGRIVYDLGSNILATPGIVSCEVMIVDADNSVLYSPSFEIYVEDRLYTDEVVETEDEFTALTAALSRVVTIEASEDARVAAENARIAAETLRETAEDSRDAAEDERAAAELERTSAEELRVSQENARDTEEDARILAEQARVSQEAARESAEDARESAELLRQSAEQERISNETSRVTAEQTRQSQETERQSDTAAAIQDANTATDRANAAAKACEDIAGGNYPSHASTHASGGSDPITPGSIGAAAENHHHGNITNDGKIGTTPFKAVYTGTGGALRAGTLPVAAGGTGGTTAAEARAGIGAAAEVHGHAIADVTGLQTALDGKQPTGNYAPAEHAHSIADVTGLQLALDNKQAAGSYAAESHTHTPSSIGAASSDHTHTLSSLGAAAAPQTKELFLDTSGWDSSGIRWETVAGVTSDSIIIVTPDSSSMKIWAEAGVRCVTSRSGELKFACDTVPSDYVTAQILIVG